MAITKQVLVYNRATALDYWKYAGFDRMAKNLMISHCPTDDNGVRIPQTGAVVLMDGYSSLDVREAAKTNGRLADHTHEFAITNWEEVIQNMRPATLQEKKDNPTIAKIIDAALTAGAPLSEDQIDAMPLELVASVTKIPHNDYTTFMAAFNTPNEASVAYDILKNNPVSHDFMSNSTNC